MLVNQRTTVDMATDICNNPKRLLHHILNLVRDRRIIKLLKKINRNRMEATDQLNNNRRSSRLHPLNSSHSNSSSNNHLPKDNGRKEVSPRLEK